MQNSDPLSFCIIFNLLILSPAITKNSFYLVFANYTTSAPILHVIYLVLLSTDCNKICSIHSQLYYCRAGKIGKITDLFKVSNQSVHDNIPSEDGIILVINVSMCLCQWKLLNAAKTWEKIYWNGVEKVWEWSSAVKWEQSRAGCRKYLVFVWRASVFSDLKKGLNWNHISVPSSPSQAGWVEFADTYTHLNKQNRSLPVSLYTFLAVSAWPSLLRLTLPVQGTLHEGTDGTLVAL